MASADRGLSESGDEAGRSTPERRDLRLLSMRGVMECLDNLSLARSADMLTPASQLDGVVTPAHLRELDRLGLIQRRVIHARMVFYEITDTGEALRMGYEQALNAIRAARDDT